MKKTIFSLFVLLLCSLTASADEPVSGQTYRICTADGLSALTNGGSANNNVVLRMTAVDDADEGQLWELTESSGYWQIKSSVGNVCADNPSESHAKWNNQLLQWQTSGGNNQKWKFVAADDGNYFMVPYENSAKCYGYNDDGTFTLRAKTDANSQIKLVKASLPTAPKPLPDGYYALQAVSAYPSYNYMSEGRFLSFSTSGSASLTTNYTYTKSRFLLKTDADGITTITLPQSNLYVYLNSASLKGAKEDVDTYRDKASFVFFMNTDEFGLDTRVAIHTGNTSEASLTESLKCLAANSTGSNVSASSLTLSNAFTFRLVPLPAKDDVDKLESAIAQAEALLSTLTDEQAVADVKAAIAAAQDELDYPYLTSSDVVKDITALLKVTDRYTSGSSTENASGNTTGIDDAHASSVTVSTANHRISVTGATHVSVYNAEGRTVSIDGTLPSGVYVVVADGETFKVTL